MELVPTEILRTLIHETFFHPLPELVDRTAICEDEILIQSIDCLTSLCGGIIDPNAKINLPETKPVLDRLLEIRQQDERWQAKGWGSLLFGTEEGLLGSIIFHDDIHTIQAQHFSFDDNSCIVQAMNGFQSCFLIIKSIINSPNILNTFNKIIEIKGKEATSFSPNPSDQYVLEEGGPNDKHHKASGILINKLFENEKDLNDGDQTPM